MNQLIREWLDANFMKYAFRRPLDKCEVSYGGSFQDHDPLYQGVDYVAPIGTNVYAITDGELINYTDSTRANVAQLNFAPNCWSESVHLLSFIANSGHVAMSDLIALSGDTGNTRGAHLHFAIILNGIRVDPEEFFNYYNYKMDEFIKRFDKIDADNTTILSTINQMDRIHEVDFNGCLIRIVKGHDDPSSIYSYIINKASGSETPLQIMHAEVIGNPLIDIVSDKIMVTVYGKSDKIYYYTSVDGLSWERSEKSN